MASAADDERAGNGNRNQGEFDNGPELVGSGAVGKDGDLDDRNTDDDADNRETRVQVCIFSRFTAEEPHRCRLCTGGANDRWRLVTGCSADHTPFPTQ